MAKKLTLQDPGEGIHEVEIREVLVARGDTVSEGDPVLVVESDKAAIEVPAPHSGKIASIDVAQGDTASVGDVLMTFDDDDDDDDASADANAEEGEGEAGTSREEPAEPADEAREAAPEGEPAAEEKKEEAEEAEDEPEGERTSDETAGEAESDRVPASPVARRVAQQHDVDLEEVEPTGPHGRVLRDDVEKAAGERAGTAEKRPARSVDFELPDFAQWGPIERRELRSIRRATARRMARSWTAIPHVTHQDVADITALEDFRRRHAAEVEAEGGKLTLTAFALKATVAALKEHPRFNASLDPETDEIIVKHYYHLGVAVDTDQGLLVPVIREVDRKSLVDLAIELTELAERARAGKLDRAAMQGGSFTITNVGALGGTGFAPIINHPEVAILGLARAAWQPVLEAVLEPGGQNGDARVVPRLVLPLCLAFDHRVVDGAAAARFTRRIADTLADVEAMTLLG